MKQNKNLLQGIKALVFLITMSIFITACKKDQSINGSLTELTDKQKLASAKSWYENQQKLSSVTLENSKDEKSKLIFNPNWEKATVDNINGITVVSTFVNTTLRNFDRGKTRFNLVIKFDEGSYKAKIVTVKSSNEKDMIVFSPSELYEIAYTKQELEKDLNAQVKVYSQALKQEKEEFYTNNGRTSINFKLNSSQRKETNYTVCIDYWYVVDNYNSNNEYTGSDAPIYLGQFCDSVDIQAIWWIDNGDGTYHGGTSTEYSDSRDTEELRSFEADYKSRMSPAELSIYNNMSRLNQINYLTNAVKAINGAIERFPNMDQTDTKLDAYRHALFNILNVFALGQTLAASLGTAHEISVNGVYSLASTMDLHNNAAGRAAYTALPSMEFDQIYYGNIVYGLVTSGALRYLKNGVLTPTNQ